MKATICIRSNKVENNLGKGGNAGKRYFLPFPKHFLKTFLFKIVNTQGWVNKRFGKGWKIDFVNLRQSVLNEGCITGR